jgi:hypothetical protein|tara:strand:+ start:7177 stop:7989 length:813 start_codon:yes stop_codon:yes gene_type:complete
MTFFNKREEVIDLEFTRFGRNLLSRGAFKPVYYRFFDDDIIYDLSRTGRSEPQSDSEQRIKNSIRLKNQYLTTGIETSYDIQSELIKEGERGAFLELSRYADPIENERILKYPLGTYNAGSPITPSFHVRVLGAPLSGSLSFIHTSGIIDNTPQLSIKPEYTYIVDRKEQKNTTSPVTPTSFTDLTADSVEFADNSKIVLQKEDIVLDIEEYSTFVGDENFEIQILKETNKGSGKYIEIHNRDEIFKFFEIFIDDKVDVQEAAKEKDRNT